jgi:anti-anti-sigma factor
MHRILVELETDTTFVQAEGELDAFAAPDLAAAFERVSGAGCVVVDLGAVSFMDSTALGLLVRSVRELQEQGGAARVVLPGSTARRIFEITTLDRVLPVAASRAEAVAQVRESP